MPPYQQRVVDEKKELDNKIGGLRVFMQTPKYWQLIMDERDRLSRQLNAMSIYSDVLAERIAAFPVQEGGSATV